ncbi:hypothetical protein LAZ67_1007590 [Cordylochernes scorpioides]|uniref:Uncharacterized protein n=1 Tax=Cordylochernes scorpioides TaxID=51811 RepID=A0ABY6JZC1_9ARAC|nr:hypothetical protein LAZ67_1007590 [Cordylochernes scorpioides]
MDFKAKYNQDGNVERFEARPDISSAIGILSIRVVNPNEHDWKALKRILGYLKSTLDLVLVFETSSSVELNAYTDADWGNEKDRKSTTEMSKTLSSQHCGPCTPTSNSLQHLEQTAFPRDMNVTTTAPLTTVQNVEDTNSSSTLPSPTSSPSNSSSLDSSSFCSNFPLNTISPPPATFFSTPVHSDNPLPQQPPSHESPFFHPANRNIQSS